MTPTLTVLISSHNRAELLERTLRYLNEARRPRDWSVDVLVAAPNGSYRMQSGTSFAAAQVSGIAALLLERNPRLDAASIRRILMSTAHDLGPPGHDEQFGSGLADAFGAVTSAGPKSSDVSGAAAASAN